MFAISQVFGGSCAPALNIVSGWHAWEIFCEVVAKKDRSVAVMRVDDLYGSRAKYSVWNDKMELVA